jgi:hypothetical protein
MSFEAFFATNFLGFKHPRIMIPLAPDCRIAKLKSINIVIIAIIQKDHQLIYIYLPLFKEGFASFFHRKKSSTNRVEELTVRPGSGVCSTLQVLLEPGGLAHG